MQVEANDRLSLPIEWQIPENLKTQFITHMVVQHSDYEFIISFFEIHPPMFLGSGEEIKEKMKLESDSIKSVKAECKARIAVSAERMPGFIQALQDNYKKLQDRQDESE
jgi:hypothetical protein